MAGIYVQKLNPKLKQNIADKAYTLSEMAQIRKAYPGHPELLL